MDADKKGVTPEYAAVVAYARKVFEDVLPDFEKIRKAARKMRYDRGTAVINALNAIEGRMTDVVGEYVGPCPECREALFDHESVPIDDEGTYVHRECADKLRGGMK